LEKAEHAQAERSTRLNDAGAWLALVRAELHWQEGDMATAAANCAKFLAWLDQKQSPWWDGMRAQLLARLAMVVLREGDPIRCRELLASALGTAAAWVERPALAAAIDAIAAFALQESVDPQAGAALAVTLLGAAHSIRGSFDEGSLDAPGARETASSPGPARSGRDGSRRRQSRWRELPNMISSQDGTEDRRPRAALRFCRPVCSAPASVCAAASPVAAGGSAAVSTAGGGPA
jgi:hypothetical protein